MLGKSVILVCKKKGCVGRTPRTFQTDKYISFPPPYSFAEFAIVSYSACLRARTAKSLILVCDIDVQFSVDLTRANSWLTLVANVQKIFIST